MHRRSLLPLLLAAAAAGCDEQPAGPEVEAAETPPIKAVVQRDTGVVTGRPLAPASGIRVNLFLPGDTLPVRQVTANNAGEAVFRGLEPGTYIVRAATTPLTTFPGREADTITVNEAATDTVRADALQVRLGGTISGTLSADFTNQQGRQTPRFGGVQITIQRETAQNSNVFETYATVTTNAAGAFSIPAEPGVRRYRIVYNAATIQGFPNDSLLIGGTGTIAPRGPVTRAAFTLAPGGTGNQSVTYQFNTRITGAVFRDADKDGVRDAGEGLVAGDTVFVQLLSATDRVIGSQRLLGPANTYTFTSLQGGSYKVRVDPLSSRFANVTPPATAKVGTPTAVTVPCSFATTTAGAACTPARSAYDIPIIIE